MAEQPDKQNTAARPLGIGLEPASQLIDAALDHARSCGLPPMTVSVLDAAGRLTAMKRQDGSSLMRPEIAQAKAWGALAMGMGSRGLAERAAGFPAFINSMTTLAGGYLVPVPGGVLVRDAEGTLLGAVGVSGASPDADEACALRGIEAVGLTAQVGGH